MATTPDSVNTTQIQAPLEPWCFESSSTFNSLIIKFVRDLEYYPADHIAYPNAIYQALQTEFSIQYGFKTEQFDLVFRSGVAMAEVC